MPTGLRKNPGYERVDKRKGSFGTYKRVKEGSSSQTRSDRALRRVGLQADRLSNLSRNYEDTYNKNFLPVSKQIIDMSKVSPDFLGDEAAVDVGMAFDESKNIANRNLSRMGINPNSGRFAGLQQQWAIARAAAEAGAKTRGRRKAGDIQFRRLLQAAGVGSFLPQLSASTARSAGGLYRNQASDLGTIASEEAALSSYLQGEIDEELGGL